MEVEGMTDTEWLVALEKIRTVHARRNRLTDTKDWDELIKLYAPDHHSYTPTEETWESSAELIENLRSITSKIDAAHQSYTPEITITSPTIAKATWGMSVLVTWRQGDEDHWILLFGHLFETYEKLDREWVINGRSHTYFLTKRSPGAILPVGQGSAADLASGGNTAH